MGCLADGAGHGALNATHLPAPHHATCLALLQPARSVSPVLTSIPSLPLSPQVGLRGYNVTRQLRLLGYDAVNLTGGWKTYQAVKAANMLPGGATNGAAKL